MAELRLQVAELLLEDAGAHEHDVLGLQGTARFHHVEELVGLGGVVVRSLGEKRGDRQVVLEAS